jgi:hypothetical protein
MAGPEVTRSRLWPGHQSSPLINRADIPILDRSRSRLRMPREVLPEAVRQASRQGLASPLATVRLETGGIIIDGRLDPIVAAMLNVIVDASLVLTVDVELEGDASVTTIWATPHRAVVTSALDPELVDIHPVRIARLPETLADVIMLRPSDTVETRTVTVPTPLYQRTEALGAQRPDGARDQLLEAGVAADDAELILKFQAPSTRCWQIGSTWATEEGRQKALVRGLDTGARGYWRVHFSEEGQWDDQLTFVPQNGEDVLRALREVLPRRWVGTALNPRPFADSGPR